jgi:hypothetical protein
LNALPHIVHAYFLSSLCVSLCFVSADALLNTFPQTCDRETAALVTALMKITNYGVCRIAVARDYVHAFTTE